MSVTSLSGTYYILGQTGTYLELTDNNLGTNLTTSHYSGSQGQQWILALATGPSASSTVYTVKNVQYQTYITYNVTQNPVHFVGQRSSPYYWFVETYQTGYAFSADSSFDYSWNVNNGYSSDNNPVILWACCEFWVLSPVSTANSSTSSTGSSSNKTPLIIGLSVGIPVGIVAIVVIIVLIRRALEGTTAILGVNTE
ncbi:hypothetical protein BU15DRAFT_81002 [Melanogaster broomeanus]|nr:hypothetical protein BU15DRAFT_81002 [Melanogaster broomeanus]